MTNAWKQDVLAGSSSVQAAHSAFCKIFIPGSLALLMNALGFGVIMLIDIPIVHELGVTACIGVMLMIITNKLMLPIILSYLKLEPSALARGLKAVGADMHCGGACRRWLSRNRR